MRDMEKPFELCIVTMALNLETLSLKPFVVILVSTISTQHHMFLRKTVS